MTARGTGPNIIITGHKNHGKTDTSIMLQDAFPEEYNFIDTSRWSCEYFIFNALKDKYGYATVDECYNDRVNHRAEWYDMIQHFNRNDAARLAKHVMEVSNVYVGMRAINELATCRNQKVIDYVIWIDSSGRGLPPEGRDSMTITEKDCDIIIRNDGDLDVLYRKVVALGLNLRDRPVINLSDPLII